MDQLGIDMTLLKPKIRKKTAFVGSTRLEDTPAIIRCREFLETNIIKYNDLRATALAVGAKSHKALIGYICHAGWEGVPNPQAICSAFNSNAERYLPAMRFWDFISSEHSPFRVLMEDGIELYKGENCTKGFILPQSTVEKYPFNFIKCFAILMRGMNEHPHVLNSWDKLTQAGMDPTEALYLCKIVVEDNNHWTFWADGGLACYKNKEGAIRGDHWGLTDSKYYGFIDWKLFKQGTPNFSGPWSGNQTYNKYFCGKVAPKDYHPFVCSVFIKAGTEQRSKFSRVSFFTTEDVINGWNTWKKDMNI